MTPKTSAKPACGERPRVSDRVERRTCAAPRCAGATRPHAGWRTARTRTRQSRCRFSVFHRQHGHYSLQGRIRGRECCHNAKVFDVGGELLSVPYDFDYSGLVNADYAGANPIVNQTNVRQRSYLGACIERAILESSVSRLAPLQSELATLAEESGLGGGQVRRVMRYLEEPLAQSPERLVARLERACRK